MTEERPKYEIGHPPKVLVLSGIIESCEHAIHGLANAGFIKYAKDVHRATIYLREQEAEITRLMHELAFFESRRSPQPSAEAEAMNNIGKRLNASLRMDVINGDANERSIMARQVKEAVDEIARLIYENERLQRLLDRFIHPGRHILDATAEKEKP